MGIRRSIAITAHIYATSPLEADEMAGQVETVLKAMRGHLGIVMDPSNMTSSIWVEEPVSTVHHRMIVCSNVYQRGYSSPEDFPLPPPAL